MKIETIILAFLAERAPAAFPESAIAARIRFVLLMVPSPRTTGG